jgi:hypothetical protein
MSNAHVGAVYDHIIQEVINAVRVDFEENGVDDGILEELKKVRTSLHSLHSPALCHPYSFICVTRIAKSIAASFPPCQKQDKNACASMAIAGSGDKGWSSWGSLLVLAVGCLDARLLGHERGGEQLASEWATGCYLAFF